MIYLLKMVILHVTDWWFGTMEFYWEEASQMMNSIIFQRGTLW